MIIFDIPKYTKYTKYTNIENIQMQQSRIDSFFQSDREKFLPLFIFDDQTETVHYFNRCHKKKELRYIATVSGLDLYKKNNENDDEKNEKKEYKEYKECTHIPIWISNLQKAVRRKETEVALATCRNLLRSKEGEVSLLRRLPIIMIEDVTLLMNYFSVLVWWMMAVSSKKYHLTNKDKDILYKIVILLCQTDEVFEFDKESKEYKECEDYKKWKKILIESSEEMSNETFTTLLSIYYRVLYGGMKGDMKMLENAISYYYHHPFKIICPSIVEKNQHFLEMDENEYQFRLLEFSIDFHPYPHLLWNLEKILKLNQALIKEWIWNAESGLNVRKKETIEKSTCYKETEEWQMIYPELTRFRQKYM